MPPAKKKTTAKKKAAKKAPDPVVIEDEEDMTLDQFRFWLQGVEEMQEEDWVPNATQWARIRERIDLIVETEIEIVKTVSPSMAPPARAPMPIAPPAPQQSSLNAPVIPPQVLTGVPPGQIVENGQVKTPDVDTSDGTFNSSFE